MSSSHPESSGSAIKRKGKFLNRIKATFATHTPPSNISSSQPESSGSVKEKGKMSESRGAFSYKPVDASKGEIRLIELVMDENDDNVRCKVITTTINNAPAYEALSYTWGSQEGKLPILLNGQRLDVTPNLHFALINLRRTFTRRYNKLHLASSDPRRLWIDAICINQQDFDERNTQIRLMRSVYANATEVIVWLGEEADNSLVAMEMVRALDLHFEFQNQKTIARIQAILDGEDPADSDSGREMDEEEDSGTGSSGVKESLQESLGRMSLAEKPGKPERLEGAAQTIGSQIQPDSSLSSSAVLSMNPRAEDNAMSPNEAGGQAEQFSHQTQESSGKQGHMNMFLMTRRPVISQMAPPSLVQRQSPIPGAPGELENESEFIVDGSPLAKPGEKGLHYMGPIMSEKDVANAPFNMLLSVHGNTWGSHEDPRDPDEWIAFRKLMERPWWRRVWVIQEVAAARGQVWVGCGSSWLRWETFLGAALAIEHYKDHPFFQRLTYLGEGTKWISDKTNLRMRDDGRMDSWGGLLNILYMTESYAATDPRDKVFALLGFTPSLSERINPDYRKPVEEIFENLVRDSIRDSGCLMMILFGKKPTRLQLPSWVPDFSIDLPRDCYNVSCPMGFFGADGNSWHTLGVRSAGCLLNPDDKRGELTVTGFVYDKPLVLGSIARADQKDRQWKFFKIITEYTALVDDTDSTHFPHLAGSHRKECFWQTLIWNANEERYPAPAKFGTYFTELMESNEILVDLNRPPHVVEETERCIPKGDAGQYYQSFLTHGLNRRFFITEKGHLASGPAEMEMGDLIAVVLGSKAPLILRRVSNQVENQLRYELVGHAYVHGIMHGEALGALDLEADRRLNGRRTLGFQEFCII